MTEHRKQGLQYEGCVFQPAGRRVGCSGTIISLASGCKFWDRPVGKVCLPGCMGDTPICICHVPPYTKLCACCFRYQSIRRTITQSRQLEPDPVSAAPDNSYTGMVIFGHTSPTPTIGCCLVPSFFFHHYMWKARF